MSISATAIVELQQNASDSNGGLFDPAQTMDNSLAVSSATTSAPVVSSVNYTFVAGDVGHWLFLKSGTNSIPGWYQIASVNAGAATLSAAAGAAFLYGSSLSSPAPMAISTATGCGTASSLTACSWSIDYSQQPTTPFALTGLTTAAANAIILTASATKAMIGNGIQITGGTNFTAGVYMVTAVSSGVSATVDRTCTTAAGAAGTANLGGAWASVGKSASLAVNANLTFQKYSASVYPITSASTNVSGGCVSFSSRSRLVGYNTGRFTGNQDTNLPVNQAQGIATAVMFTGGFYRNIACDGQSLTSIRGFATGNAEHCIALNMTNSGFSAMTQCRRCLAKGCTTAAAFTGSMSAAHCAAIDCTGVNGFAINSASNSVARGCSIGFQLTGGSVSIGLSSYNNTSDGIQNNATDGLSIYDAISYGNGGQGFNNNSKLEGTIVNYATGANIGTAVDPAWFFTNGPKLLSGNPWSNPTATINTIEDVWTAFQLNSTAGAGAVCRGAGVMPYDDIGAVQHQDPAGGGHHFNRCQSGIVIQ